MSNALWANALCGADEGEICKIRQNMAMRALLENRGTLTRCGNSRELSTCPSVLRKPAACPLARRSVVGSARQMKGSRQARQLRADTFIEGSIAAQGTRLCFRVCAFNPSEMLVTNALCPP